MSENKQNIDTEKQHIDSVEESIDENSAITDTEKAEGTPQEPELSVEEKLQIERDQINDRYLRLYAEFDNYKRRTAKERVEMMQSAGKDVIGNLLTVLDDFDRALKMMERTSDVTAVKEGIELINQKFRTILQQQGLKEMEAIGQAFDADYHEAITNVPSPTEEQKGKVIDEVEKGYFLNDKVLRYAKVVVGN